MPNLTIKSDGLASNTFVTVGGEKITDVTEVVIAPIKPGGHVMATITAYAKIDVTCISDQETQFQLVEVEEVWGGAGQKSER